MMNGQTRQNILVDTSIPLEGGEDIIAKLDKVAPVFVTDIVLQELDGHKNNANGAIAYQAREFFRRLGKTNGEALFVLPPDGMKLEKTDTLRRMTLGNTTLHVIVRKPYKSRDINDSKIIEVAKDYNMTLVTLDMAQRVRAMSEGVNVETLRVEEKRKKHSNKIFGLIAGITLLFLAVIGFSWLFLSYYFGVQDSKSPIPFILILIIIACGIGVANFFYEAKGNISKNNENSSESMFTVAGLDTVNDTAYSSLDGNIYHSN